MRASSTFRQESRPQAAALWLEDHVFFRTGLHVVNSGGQTNLGVVLPKTSRTATGNFRVLYSFASGDAFASYSQAALTFDRAGALYGP